MIDQLKAFSTYQLEWREQFMVWRIISSMLAIFMVDANTSRMDLQNLCDTASNMGGTPL
jgi:hypothetical protein